MTRSEALATIRGALEAAGHTNNGAPGCTTCAALAALEAEAPAVRPEVLAFALAMEERLRANDHKGGWSKDHPLALYKRLLEEAIELRTEVEVNLWRVTGPSGDEDRTHVRHEAADVANFALMIADVCGALPAKPVQRENGFPEESSR